MGIAQGPAHAPGFRAVLQPAVFSPLFHKSSTTFAYRAGQPHLTRNPCLRDDECKIAITLITQQRSAPKLGKICKARESLFTTTILAGQ
jgi:hypothetical protein